MNLNKAKTISLLIALSLSSSFMAGCATGYQTESTGQYVDSSAITAKVKTQLLADKYVPGSAITVKTYKNGVQLSGFVNSARQKQRAELIARNVEGVTYVDNALIVK